MIRIPKLVANATLKDIALAGAGPVLTLMVAANGLVLWLGGWPPGRAEQQLWYLGTALLLEIGLLAIVIVTLTGVRLHAKGVAGTELSLDPENVPPNTVVTQRVEATVESKTAS